jgi:hypothetical protein
MPRIYYKEEKLCGTPVETAVVNAKNFKTIIGHPFFRGGKKDISTIAKSGGFNYCSCNDDGIFYENAEHGSFYLPKSLIFFDRDDANFPSEFYFLALIGDTLEARRVSAGKGIEWFQIPGLSRELTDANILRRIETTMESLLAFIKDYKEPKRKKIEGFDMDKYAMREFLRMLNSRTDFVDETVETARSPEEAFAKNEDFWLEHNDEPFKNMYVWYVVHKLEEQNILKTIDWKTEYENISENLNRLTGTEIADVESEEKTAEDILSDLSKNVDAKLGKVIFCIDTDSDMYAFGIIEKYVLPRLVQAGKKAGIKVFLPNEY